MKILELLEELKAQVHRNVDKTLTVLPSLIQYAHEFDVEVPESP